MTAFLDRSRLAAIAQGSGVTQAAMLAKFLRLNAAEAVLLRQAFKDKDFACVGFFAHRMVGASLMLGATRLASVCSTLSAASGAEDAAGVQAALASLDDEVAVLTAELDALGHGAEAAQAIPPGAGQPALLCSDLSFLVVEDHEFQRGVIMRLLRRLGAREVHGCADGASALKALADPATPGDIVVLDLSMPGMTGIELLGRIGAAHRPVSVILNSALDADLLAAPLQAGRSDGVRILGAVSKPLTASSLAPLIALYRAGVPG